MRNVHRVHRHITAERSTLLGVGPMSKEVVFSAIELANFYDKPIALIASRRQIDSEEFGGGYVENWSTSEFVQYVRTHDKKGNVLIARDHGGPWQNPREVSSDLGLAEALESAKMSFYEDIKAGFDMIHIDTSVDIHRDFIPQQEVVDRVVDLYTFCHMSSKDLGRDLLYEVGTEEQSSCAGDLEYNSEILSKTKEILNRRGLPLPTFIVLQTGTRVQADRNIGSLDRYDRVPGSIPAEIALPQIIKFCQDHNIYLKEHNLDYASDDLLSWHPRLGIHSANVAPEFGVTQSKAIFELLISNNLHTHYEQLVKVAVESNKWEKWSDSSTGTPDRKAVLCAHYCYSTSEFKNVLTDAYSQLSSLSIDYESFLKQAITTSINRYLVPFGYPSKFS